MSLFKTSGATPAVMHIFRIKITMTDGSRGHYTGIFADSFEAVLQTLADFPQAASVSAICIRNSRRHA